MLNSPGKTGPHPRGKVPSEPHQDGQFRSKGRFGMGGKAFKALAFIMSRTFRNAVRGWPRAGVLWGKSGPFQELLLVDMSGFMSGLEGVSKALSMVSKERLIKFVHFFGGKFKPWSATKCMKWIKATGPILSVIGNIMDFVQLAKDKQHQQKLQEARYDIISSFSETETGILPQLEEIKNAEGSIGQILNGLLNSLNEREQKQQELCQHKEQLLIEFKRIKAELDGII